jgi:hypothetical protein
MRSRPCGAAARPSSDIFCVPPLGGVVRTADGVIERPGALPRASNRALSYASPRAAVRMADP